MLKKACCNLSDFRLAYHLFNQEEASEAPKCPFMHHGKEVTPAPAATAKEETASGGTGLSFALCACQLIILGQTGLNNNNSVFSHKFSAGFAYESFFKEQIRQKKLDHSYRIFKKVNRSAESFPAAREFSWDELYRNRFSPKTVSQ